MKLIFESWRRYLAEQANQYYGTSGAGVLVISPNGKILVAKRSAEVEQPGTWSNIGGKIEEGEDPRTAAEIEFREETAYRGPITLLDALVFQDKNFSYHNFIGIVGEEFTPVANFETSEFRWLSLEEVRNLKPMHFGLARLLSDKGSMETVQRAINGQFSVDPEAPGVFMREREPVEIRKRFLYHTTGKENVEKIMASGGVLGSTRPKWFNEKGEKEYRIYFWDDEGAAKMHAFGLDMVELIDGARESKDVAVLVVPKPPGITFYRDLEMEGIAFSENAYYAASTKEWKTGKPIEVITIESIKAEEEEEDDYDYDYDGDPSPFSSYGS